MESTNSPDKKPSYCYRKLFQKHSKNASIRKPNRYNENSLSKIIEKHTKVLNNKALNCVGKSITHIDTIPYVYTNVDSLYLARNLLNSLQGIEQFNKLRILDISNNEISDLNEIMFLKELRNLEILTCENNPICDNPAFFDTTVALLSSLRLFNGKAISVEDKTISRNRLKEQTYLLEKLLENYCELVRLQSILNRLNLHENLCKLDPCFDINLQRSFNSNLLKKYCTFSEILDENTIENMRKDLVQDIEILKVQFSQQNQDFNQVDIYDLLHAKQLERIGVISTAIDYKVAILKQKQPLQQTIPLKETPEKPSSEIKLKNFLNQRTSFPMKTEQILEKTLLKEKHKSELIDRSIEKKFEKSTVEKKEKDRRANNKSQINEPSQSFSRDKSVNKDLSKTAVKLNTSNMLSPVKRFISEKDRLIDQIGQELTCKAQELSQLESLNLRLKLKLEEFQTQNEENARLFRDEAVNSNMQMKKLGENNKVLEQEVQHNNEKINELLIKNHSLQKSLKLLEDYEIKMKQYERKLDEKAKDEEKWEKAQELNEHNLIRKAFWVWQQRKSLEKHRSSGIKEYTQEKSKKTLEFFFNQWQKFFFINKIIKTKAFEKNNLLQASFFRDWKKTIDLKKKYKKNKKAHFQRLLVISMVYWKQYIRNKKTYRVQNSKGLDFKKILYKKRFFSIWTEKYNFYNLPVAEAIEYEKKADNFLRMIRNQRVFSILYLYSKKIAIPKKKNTKKAEKFHISMLKIQGFSQWKKILNLKKSLWVAALSFEKIKKKGVLHKLIEKWHFYSRFAVGKRNKFEKMRVWFVKMRKMKAWRKAYLESKRFKEITERTERNYDRRIKMKVLKGLKINRYTSKRNRKTLIFLQKKTQNELLRRVYEGFRIILSHRNKRINQEKQILNIKKGMIFQKLIDYLKLKRRNRFVSRLAMNFKAKVLKREQENIFYSIKKHFYREKKLKNILENQKQKLNKKKLLCVFTNVKNFWISSIRAKLAGIHNINKDYHMEMQEKNQFLDDIRRENELLSDELKVAKRKISEMQENELNLNRNLSEVQNELNRYEAIEFQLKEDVKDKIGQIKLLNGRNEALNEEVERNAKVFDRRNENMRQEKEGLLRMIHDLKEELEIKKNTMLDFQGDSVKKSGEANFIIKSLESRIEDLVKKIEEINIELNIKNQEIKEMRRFMENIQSSEEKTLITLRNTENILSDQRVDYENKVVQLETENKLLSNENNRLLDNNKHYCNKIEELKGEYKTLEYKMKLLSSEGDQNIDEFIRKVSKKEKNTLLETQQESYERPRLTKETREKTPINGLSLLESLNKEVEELKVNRNNLKENLEYRMRVLSQNIETDFSKVKTEIKSNYYN